MAGFNFNIKVTGPVLIFLAALFSSHSAGAQWKAPLEKDSISTHPPVRSFKIDVDKTRGLIHRDEERPVIRRSGLRPVRSNKLALKRDYKVLEYADNGTPEWVEVPLGVDLRSKNGIRDFWKSYKETFGIRGEVELEAVYKPNLEVRDRPDHERYDQQIGGIKIYDSEVLGHRLTNKTVIRSKVYRGGENLDVEGYKSSVISRDRLEAILESEFGEVKERKSEVPVRYGILRSELQWYFMDEDAAGLVYVVDYMPGFSHHYHVVVDAVTGEIYDHFDKVCNITGNISTSCSTESHTINTSVSGKDRYYGEFLSPVEGAGRGLNGVEYRFPVWSQGDGFYLIDASQPMFNEAGSDMPADPDGAIITLDGQNKSIEDEDFSLFLIGSESNRFDDRRAVSAHVNAILSYRYYLETFGRNSIDGNGGNILSIVDVLDEDSEEMDNAFWNGAAIFYGNGNSDFHSPLSRSLDVGAHELTHGVIQSSGNMRYQGESGALNESFADVFAVLIDRDDWTVGEEIVNGNIFPNGSLRDLSDPHNGGQQLGDAGWQPGHVNEQYFGDLDEGGVHINSGIPNYAFYLIASQIGLEKAEQLYYDVLTNYMTFSSDFKDLRYSVLTAAEDQFGPSSEEYSICRQAFQEVGILEESGPSQPEEGILEENPGDNLMLAISDDQNAIQLINLETGSAQQIVSGVEIYSKPSITDDGSFGVFVDGDFRIQYISINWNTLELTRDYLENNPQSIWRKIVVSKDGRLVAAVTEEPIDEKVYLFNLETGENNVITLYNPTTSSDFFTTNDVQYIDAMEFDHAGEYILYDAYNEIGDILSFESAHYWDIGLVRVFDPVGGNFTEPRVDKIFSNLDDEISVGNPTFSKNDINVFAFDYYDEGEDRNYIGTADLLSGNAQLIYEGNTIHYPSYTKDDSYILFDSEAGILEKTFEIRAMEMSENRLESVSEDFAFVEAHRWATPFANGDRELILTSSGENTESFGSKFEVFPNPAKEQARIRILDHTITLSEVEIYDIKGRKVYTHSFDFTEEIQLDLSGWFPGVYIMQLVDRDKKRYIGKLIVN